jgi:hypothetical protein
MCTKELGTELKRHPAGMREFESRFGAVGDAPRMPSSAIVESVRLHIEMLPVREARSHGRVVKADHKYTILGQPVNEIKEWGYIKPDACQW